MIRILLLCALALFAVGCHRAPLHCRSEYLYPDYLASAHVLTPDPCRFSFFGQQIVVRWNLNRASLPADLVLYIRYKTREQETLCWTITNRQGYKIFRLINNQYWCREGIISFKAEIYKDGVCLTDWSHHLWADFIEIRGD